jgi:co-chaperonin GroES (HSP10)
MLKPRAGKILVKRVETEDTLPNGKVHLLEDTTRKMTSGQFEIVDIGEPLTCDDEDCNLQMHWKDDDDKLYHPFDADIGDWVILAPRSPVATDDPALFIALQDDVLALLVE